MNIVIDVPEKYYKDAKRMVWSSTYSGSLISGWLRNAIPVIEKDGYFVVDEQGVVIDKVGDIYESINRL